MAAHHVSVALSGDKVVKIGPAPPEMMTEADPPSGTLAQALLDLCDALSEALRDVEVQKSLELIPETTRTKIDDALAAVQHALQAPQR